MLYLLAIADWVSVNPSKNALVTVRELIKLYENYLKILELLGQEDYAANAQHELKEDFALRFGEKYQKELLDEYVQLTGLTYLVGREQGIVEEQLDHLSKAQKQSEYIGVSVNKFMNYD